MPTGSDLALGAAVGLVVAVVTHLLMIVGRVICHIVNEVFDQLAP